MRRGDLPPKKQNPLIARWSLTAIARTTQRLLRTLGGEQNRLERGVWQR
ncbi:hypothetical protein RE6C_05245 [Rhodopirellula europaea 6C]|uniref:Uncharacterized protein n=1 Tax=Rhodopirellula europaea 6C TaxID=1263867 RepID=M2A3W8_9BACT|nr:hypothetical protein RE6C_05245 [Rhodopirellula europaea 6C]